MRMHSWTCTACACHFHILRTNMGAEACRRCTRPALHRAQNGAWWFLHDNDKKFHSKLVQDFLFSVGVSHLDFPPYSPDVNPMENLWATMARAVEKHQCETMEELQDAVAEEWDNLDKDHMRSLALSMPHRMAAVIEAKGWHTAY